MKKLAIGGIFIVLVALIVSGHALAEEQQELSTKEVKTPNTQAVNALSSPKQKARDYLVYVSGGFSHFREDVNAMVGEGSGFRIASGIQYNEWFGLEVFGEAARPIDPSLIINNLRTSPDQRILSRNITTRNNKYLGILGKFSFDVSKQVSLFGKVGFAAYEAHQFTANLTLADIADYTQLTRVRLEGRTTGYSPVVSVGYEIPLPYPDSKKTSGELSLTQMFDDKVKNFTWSVTLKYTF